MVATWSDEEVVRRILIINRLPRHFGGELKPPTEQEIRLESADPQRVAAYRRRLSNVSCFMGSLDESIARRSNHEDQVTGHFWEERFGCRNLEDESAILVCGIYIDLNQIRAGEAVTPETSRHTSAYNRIQGLRSSGAAGGCEDDPAAAPMPPDGWLCELTLHEGLDSDVRDGLRSSTPWRLTDKGILPLGLTDYLSLLDWTGRQQASGEGGAIPGHLASILERLHIRPRTWLGAVSNFEALFGRVIGRADNVARRLARSGRSWVRGAGSCAEVFT